MPRKLSRKLSRKNLRSLKKRVTKKRVIQDGGSIFLKLKGQKKGKGGEIHITDTIQSLINEKEKFIGHTFSGKYLDCGTMKGYINSSKEISKL